VNDWESALEFIQEDVRAIVTDRHRKYGPGNVREYGELGLIIRCRDKLARLQHHVDTGTGDMPDESVEDAWADLAGLALIGLMFLRGWWELPFEGEPK